MHGSATLASNSSTSVKIRNRPSMCNCPWRQCGHLHQNTLWGRIYRLKCLQLSLSSLYSTRIYCLRGTLFWEKKVKSLKRILEAKSLAPHRRLNMERKSQRALHAPPWATTGHSYASMIVGAQLVWGPLQWTCIHGVTLWLIFSFVLASPPYPYLSYPIGTIKYLWASKLIMPMF